MEIIQRGAEAVISLDKGKNKVIKERIKKSYRAEKLDERIRKHRTKIETRLLRGARSLGILTPVVFDSYGNKIEMEYIDGKKVKDILNIVDRKSREFICSKISEYVATLHEFGIIHGDLTTSNFIIFDSKIYLIDFGLGFYSNKIEDKATDLYLLYNALKSTHFKVLEDSWKLILNVYKKKYKEGEKIIKKLEEIKERGRYVIRKK